MTFWMWSFPETLSASPSGHFMSIDNGFKPSTLLTYIDMSFISLILLFWLRRHQVPQYYFYNIQGISLEPYISASNHGYQWGTRRLINGKAERQTVKAGKRAWDFVLIFVIYSPNLFKPILQHVLMTKVSSTPRTTVRITWCAGGSANSACRRSNLDTLALESAGALCTEIPVLGPQPCVLSKLRIGQAQRALFYQLRAHRDPASYIIIVQLCARLDGSIPAFQQDSISWQASGLSGR